MKRLVITLLLFVGCAFGQAKNTATTDVYNDNAVAATTEPKSIQPSSDVDKDGCPLEITKAEVGRGSIRLAYTNVRDKDIAAVSFGVTLYDTLNDPRRYGQNLIDTDIKAGKSHSGAWDLWHLSNIGWLNKRNGFDVWPAKVLFTDKTVWVNVHKSNDPCSVHAPMKANQ